MPGWEWRRRYRVWDANRKIFLYPENWIEPELRSSPSVDEELRPIVAAARRDPDLDDELLQRFHFVIEGRAGESSSAGLARWRRVVRRRL